MTTALCPTVRLTDPTQWFASVPHLLGFHPTDSVVLMGLAGEAGRSPAVFAVRADLPPADHQDEYALVIEHLARPLRCAPTDEVLIFVIGGESSTRPPYESLVNQLVTTIEDTGSAVVHALWAPATVGGHEWLCYQDSACRGTVEDYNTSALAAASAAAGQITYADRSALAAVIAPDPDEVLTARSVRIDELLDAPTPDPEYFGDGSMAWALRQVTEACARFRSRTPTLNEADHCRLVLAISDPMVRDAAVGLIHTEPVAARRLFTALTRATPPPERAQPASLLALAAYSAGDGAAARVALDAALAAWPEHRLSLLLRTALDHGLAPAQINRIVVAGSELARCLTDGEVVDVESVDEIARRCYREVS